MDQSSCNYIFNMSKIIRNFLTKPSIDLPFFKRGLLINNRVLNSIQPDLYVKLQACCISYMEGLIDFDEEYLEQTTSPFMYYMIKKEIQQLKGTDEANAMTNGFVTKMKNYGLYLESEDSTENTPKVAVYPYVAFGCKIKERVATHPLDQVIQITRNRFVRKYNHNSLGQYIKSLSNYTCGFRFEFLPINLEKEELEPVSITLQSDLDTNELYVIDLNNQILTGLDETQQTTD